LNSKKKTFTDTSILFV